MRQQDKSRDTKEKILAAAERSFATRGYDATGVAEICKDARISKGAFYHHFPSKQAVFLDLLNRWLASLNQQMQLIQNQASNIPEAFHKMAGVVNEVFKAGGHQLHIFLEFLTKAVRDPTVWNSTIAPYRQYRAYFADMINKGIKEGSFRAVDADRLSQVFVSLGVGIVLQGLLDPHGANWEQVSQMAIDIFLGNMLVDKIKEQ